MTTAGTIRTALTALATLLLTFTTSIAQETRPVDVVVMLDTSGSMENLLDATRARVWDVVNELGRMKPTPELQVGLVSFGTDKATEDQGFIVQHLDLTADLDQVYAELMGLTIGGGTELVGRALNEAIDVMSWSPEYNGLRVVFVAGNESADQGTFSAIDPSTSSIQIANPQNDLLLELNGRLNTTYVPYGERGQNGLTNQIAQDSNASRLGVQSCSSRIVAKGGTLYTNASWDLVDKTLEEGFDWDAIYLTDLPEKLQSMTVDERAGFIAGKRAQREGIQREIHAASAAREEFVQQAIASRIGESGLR